MPQGTHFTFLLYCSNTKLYIARINLLSPKHHIPVFQILWRKQKTITFQKASGAYFNFCPLRVNSRMYIFFMHKQYNFSDKKSSMHCFRVSSSCLTLTQQCNLYRKLNQLKIIPGRFFIHRLDYFLVFNSHC